MIRVLPLVLAATALAAPLNAQEVAGIQVDIAIARTVMDRMPVDSASTFPADVGQVACWTRVTGATDRTIHHVWIHGENEFPVSLQIGGSPWRTWSTKVIPTEWAGEWRVEVRDASGTVLASAAFTVGQ